MTLCRCLGYDDDYSFNHWNHWFVGSHLAEYLLAETDWSIVGMTRWQDDLSNVQLLIPLVNEGKRVCFGYGDLGDPLELEAVVEFARPDYIFHLAAQSYPPASYRAPIETMRTNVQGTMLLMDAILRHVPNAWIHNCSSSEVYGNPDKTPITEDTPFHPLSPYAISKASADMIGRFYYEAYGLKVLTTRMFTHTGPRRGDVFAESSFAKQIAMIEVGQLDPPIKVGNLDSLRTIADVRDAVRAYYMLLTHNPIAGEVYNIGGTHVCTVGQILETLCEIAGHNYPIEVDKARLRPLDATNQVPDCTKFLTHTNWRPEIPFQQTMTDLLNYWRDKVKTGAYLTR